MSGRYEQLGRQLRKVRTALAKQDGKATAVALRRATHLASDLVFEQAESEDITAALAELQSRALIDGPLAERLGGAFTAEVDREHEPTADEVNAAGRDLDRLLRSLEHGAAMPDLPFVALDAIEVPAAETRVALTISGRHVVLGCRGGEGLVFVDDRPVGRPFPTRTAPTSKAEIEREPSGRTRITWESEGLVVALGPDFATAEVSPLQAA
ncbi:MAG: hypothetical protein H0T46_16720 [Deltaproteobacteria bacterium]|nr:hypothetical protein [Deltaproteobacteria bacterium]